MIDLVAEKAIELLEKVHDLIRDTDGWTRAAFARDRDGMSTEPGEPEACSFCLVGALSHVSKTEHAAALAGEGTADERLAAAELVHEGIAHAQALVDSLIRETGWQTLVSGWNDHAGHESVKRLVRLAQDKLRRQLKKYSESGRGRFELWQVEREVDGVDVDTALVRDRQTGQTYDANYRDESPAFAFVEGFELAERLLRGAEQGIREGADAQSSLPGELLKLAESKGFDADEMRLKIIIREEGGDMLQTLTLDECTVRDIAKAGAELHERAEGYDPAKDGTIRVAGRYLRDEIVSQLEWGTFTR